MLFKSNLVRLDLLLDQNGILRVGGRLNRSSLAFEEKHPILLPTKHYLSQLIMVPFTHGTLRPTEFWVINGHREISRIINACITCKKLRGRTLTRHMADLPVDRTESQPPITNVGLDVFGTWRIKVKKLRGTAATAKTLRFSIYLPKQ